MDNFFLVTLLFWPAAVLLSAGFNMLIWKTFSWSELIVDYLVGVGIGSIFYATTTGTHGWWMSLLVLMSHGPAGMLRLAGVHALADPATFFWASAGTMVGATALSAVLDRLEMAIGKTMTPGGILLSTIIFPCKAPFAPLSSLAGILLFLAGVVRSFFGCDGGVGFLSGVLYIEWDRSVNDREWTTTIGCVVNSWMNRFETVVEHELYHSRQYIYLHDWLMPAWLLGEAARLALSRSNQDNPIERGAYTLEERLAS